MGTYVNPSSLVPQKGRKVELQKTFAETSTQLRDGEKLCAYANGAGGQVGLVIMHAGDFSAVSGAPGRLIGLYAIGSDVLEHAG